MQRLILTLAQARALQQNPGSKEWAFLLETPIPTEPDNLLDPERGTAGLKMIAMGCESQQIALQLNLKPDGSAMRQLYRLHNRGTKKA